MLMISSKNVLDLDVFADPLAAVNVYVTLPLPLVLDLLCQEQE